MPGIKRSVDDDTNWHRAPSQNERYGHADFLPPAPDQRLHELARFCAQMYVALSRLTERVDQLQQFIESRYPPGDIILTVGQEGTDQPDYTQTWTQHETHTAKAGRV